MKLIDFGIANFLSNSGKNIHKFGTKKYAAPEQMTDKPLDEKTDVYGVGKVLAHMLSYMKPGDVVRLLPMIRRATKKNPTRRTQSITILKQQLKHKQHKKNCKQKNKKHLEKTIAVVGSDRGVGCTHIAIALVNYLNQAGLDAYYRNYTEQRVLEQMASQDVISVQKDGIIYHESFRGVIYYNPGEQRNPPGGIQVIDCGCYECPQAADATIYVCGGRLWQKWKDPKWHWGEKDIVLCNFFNGYQARKFAREHNQKVYVYPFQKDPFVAGPAVWLVFSYIVGFLK